MMKATEAWRILRSGTSPDSLRGVATLEAETDSPQVRPRYAIGPDQLARLLIPMPDNCGTEEIPRSDALQIRVNILEVHGRLEKFLDIQCLDAALESVFGDVVDEILARMQNRREPLQAVRTTLEDFRALLTVTRAEEVSLARVVGLVSELVVLNSLLDIDAGAWRAWTGPLGDRHDFRSDSLSLEVKASSRLSNRTVVISSMEQLEPLPGGELLMIYHVLERVPGGELGVLRLARQALNRASEPGQVENRLNRLGCSRIDAPEWNRHSFVLARKKMLRVAGGFPRLVPSMLPAGSVPQGITSVTYEIDLSALGPFEMNQQEWEEAKRRIAQCR